mmetsp:Transcript_113468/g.316000  ORF Transcript_113468/g.316000 Transcript_113468/m.316000 type:complete len:93 (+) Transcript_113468:1618-1896(+)
MRKWRQLCSGHHGVQVEVPSVWPPGDEVRSHLSHRQARFFLPWITRGEGDPAQEHLHAFNSAREFAPEFKEVLLVTGACAVIQKWQLACTDQ